MLQSLSRPCGRRTVVTRSTTASDIGEAFRTRKHRVSKEANLAKTCFDHGCAVADLVALGTVTSVQNCGGPQIPYRGGRVDATGPGAAGVPAPDTNLSQTLQFFANSGFGQKDSIALTACGHTMGYVYHKVSFELFPPMSIIFILLTPRSSVHHGGFPTVVNASYVTPNNTQGGARLDTTFDKFDLNVVTEYVGRTGNLGGPLVSSFNETSRSDLRLYQSDNNERMMELSQSTEAFFSTCQLLLGRMIDTVPRGIQLSEPVKPLTLKPVNVSLDMGRDGELTLSGAIRVSDLGTIPIAKIINLLHNSTLLAL